MHSIPQILVSTASIAVALGILATLGGEHYSQEWLRLAVGLTGLSLLGGGIGNLFNRPYLVAIVVFVVAVLGILATPRIN